MGVSFLAAMSSFRSGDVTKNVCVCVSVAKQVFQGCETYGVLGGWDLRING